jgi:hypothetical protein
MPTSIKSSFTFSLLPSLMSKERLSTRGSDLFGLPGLAILKLFINPRPGGNAEIKSLW